MLVAIGSVKGFGATTLAVGLAARWPEPGAVVVEADPAGGDLAFRFGHHREPGLSELAADARRCARGLDLSAYTQRLAIGVDVVFGAAAPAQPQAVPAVATLLDGGGLDVLRTAAGNRLVVVDVGRLDWQSRALPLACAADVLLLVTRSGVDGVDAVQVRRDALLDLAGMRASVRLVLAGRPFCPADEIARVVGLPVAGHLPEDRRGAAVLSGLARPRWGWTRLELLRAARALALSIHGEATHVQAAGPPARAAAPVPTVGGVAAVSRR